MGDVAAKKIEPTAPDGSKPVKIKYWYLPGNLGTLTQHAVTVGGEYVDGVGTNGKVRDITLYPNGIVIVELACGWQPGKLETDQLYSTEYVAISVNGHGRVKL